MTHITTNVAPLAVFSARQSLSKADRITEQHQQTNMQHRHCAGLKGQDVHNFSPGFVFTFLITFSAQPLRVKGQD
jgi:hypothetical protein